MDLEFIGVDPDSDKINCPTFWVSHDTQEIVTQGWNAGAELLDACRETGEIPDTESVVRIPFRMIPLLREACDAAERGTAGRAQL
ncbi:hypothetical protein GXW82_39175 [Streptacidiphilus sp. 4-A2]|nr:hypothetical protein [Streptacidiphilus sp. 4-A2]